MAATNREPSRHADPAGTLAATVSAAVEHCQAIQRGRVADYIPQLASVDPARLGMAACDLDGAVVGVGDADVPFTMQSMVKPFLFAIALERFGEDVVRRRVGVEPTGQEFDSFTRLESSPYRPSNPMVNAGAIAVTDLLLSDAASTTECVEGILAVLSECAGRPLFRDAEVFESERQHGARNRVIAHLMKHCGLITSDVEAATECYFAACSTLVTCRDMAVMGACLAGGGRHPISGSRLVSASVARAVLTVMTTCGMYDASGRFAWEVGLPAKSGVAGGIFAVVPGRYGVAVYSPRLDPAGNSVRGWAAMRAFAGAIDGHAFSSHGERRTIGGRALVEPAVARAYRAARAETGGRRADYLPRLAGSPLAIAVCSVDREEYAVGDVETCFSIQAVANPLALSHALAHVGERRVRRIVGEEPSGDPFHAILIDQRRKRPFNAMGNAGAIAIASLNAGVDGFDPGSWLALLAGRASPFPVDHEVFAAEKEHAHRNHAIASLLREVGAIDDDAAAVDLYLRQCSIAVTVRDVARIAATLANGGVRPLDGRRVAPSRVATKVLTVMYTCGMHDHSGQFAMDVGVPAKSGVSGCIMAVIPGVMGIAVLSPNIDDVGASVPGRAAVRSLATSLEAIDRS